MELVMNRQREKGGGGGSAYNSPDTSASALQSSLLSDRNKSGQMTDSPQSQIQRMMQSSGGGQSPYLQSPPGQQQVPVNPMDPQPFYISGDSPHQLPPHQPPAVPQRRTWGQPQPINFGQPAMNWGGPRPMFQQPQYPQPQPR